MHPDAAAFHDLHDGQATACRPDPEAHLAELARAAGPLRRAVAAIAGRFVGCEGWKRLGYARPGDYARERLGRSTRSLQEWARVDRSLAVLPGLEHALLDGTLAWSKVRLLARFVNPEDEASWIAYARSKPVRVLEREVRAASRGALEAGGAGVGAAKSSDRDGEACEEPRTWVRVPTSVAVGMKWQRLRRAAPQVAGQRLPPDEVLEIVTAEVLSALPLQVDLPVAEPREAALSAVANAAAEAAAEEEEEEEGKRDEGIRARGGGAPEAAGPSGDALESSPTACALPVFLRPLVDGPEAADPFELDARLRRAMRLEQRLEADMGPLLRQVSAPDYEWQGGVTSLAAFARERLGVSARKLRALLRVERVGDVCPSLRAAYRDGRLSWYQAQLLARVVAHACEGAWRERWVAFAQEVSVRRLEEAVEAALAAREIDPEAWVRWREAPGCCADPLAALAALEADGTGASNDGERQVCALTGAEIGDEPASEEGCRIAIAAHAELARLFRATLCSVRLAIEEETGHLPSEGRAFEAMLDHAARSWGLDDPWLRRRKPEAVRIFERDGWRCTVPGCSSRRNLQSHHIEFRSQGGGDEDSNQTTLCAFHHLRGVHAGVIAVRGQAPGALVFELGCRSGRRPLERYRSGDRRIDL